MLVCLPHSRTHVCACTCTQIAHMPGAYANGLYGGVEGLMSAPPAAGVQ